VAVLKTLPDMPATERSPMPAADTIEDLQTRQAALYAQAELEVEAERAKYPDCQTWSSPLGHPAREFDPSPAEQQEWADAFRAENLNADQPTRFGVTRTNPEGYVVSPLSEALGQWRTEEAQRRWSRALGRMLAPRPCQVCGASSQHDTLWVGGQTRPVCRRCRPSVLAAQAAHVAEEKLPDGRTRADAAAQLVDSTTKAG
jgi:hypothetical protein